ncbi:MAG: DUF4105 domain-containing protein [Bacteroidales bacterium]
MPGRFAGNIIVKIRVWIILGLLAPWVQLFPFSLSKEASVSLLTCGPGTELYSLFGHTALRIKDDSLGFDRVYNYGTFNFQEKGFYWKFLRGELFYYLSVAHFNQFMALYYAEEREVTEQILQLDPEEATRIFLFVENNLKPENRAYLYDFIRDNCTTRIRDLLVSPHRPDAGQSSDSVTTARMHLRKALHPFPYSGLGIDLLLGARTDHPITLYQSLFLPELLKQQLEKSIHPDTGHPLVKESRILLKGQELRKPSPLLQPILLLLVLLLLSALLALGPFRMKRANQIFNRLIFTTLGTIGIIIAFMWFVSSHYHTALNWNLLLFSPLCLFFAFSTKQTKRKTLRLILLLILISLIIYPVALVVSKQAISIESGIIAFTLLFRLHYLSKQFRSAMPKPL